MASFYAGGAQTTRNNTDHRRLLESIDDKVAALVAAPWEATLPFPIYQCEPDEVPPVNGAFPSGIFTERNLFELTSDIMRGGIARFDPKEFPVNPQGGMKVNDKSWKKLCAALIDTSKKCGNWTIASNGSHGSNKDRKVLVCARFRHYQEPKHVAHGEFRKHTLNLNRQNARHDYGQSQKKKTATARPTKSNDDQTCKVKLIIGIDQHSFFVVCGFWTRHASWTPTNGRRSNSYS